MKKLLLIFSAFCMIACGGSKKTTENQRYTIESLQNKTEQQVLSMYDNANHADGREVTEEGVERPYTILYPGSKDEILITWKNDAKTSIFDIHYSENGKWTSNKGIKIGTSYQELTKINGKEVEFYGFGWDYSGAVDWNGGKLQGSNIRVFLNPEGEVPEKFYSDRKVTASKEEIEALNLKVSTIMYRD